MWAYENTFNLEAYIFPFVNMSYISSLLISFVPISLFTHSAGSELDEFPGFIPKSLNLFFSFVNYFLFTLLVERFFFFSVYFPMSIETFILAVIFSNASYFVSNKATYVYMYIFFRKTQNVKLYKSACVFSRPCLSDQ